MPRRSLLTPDAQATFLQAIELGATIKLAAQAAGWAEPTVYAYLADGRAARDLHTTGTKLTPDQRRKAEFVEAFEKAEGTMARNALAAVVRAAQRPQHWTAAAWLLERRFPETYGRRMVEVMGKDGGPIEVDVQAAELLAELRALGGREPAPNGSARIRNGSAYTPPLNGVYAPEVVDAEEVTDPEDPEP